MLSSLCCKIRYINTPVPIVKLASMPKAIWKLFLSEIKFALPNICFFNNILKKIHNIILSEKFL